MNIFGFFSGIITAIEDFWTGDEWTSGCYKLVSVQNRDGNKVNFVVTPDTYFVDNWMMVPGNAVTGFYDLNAPVPLIYPPQYRAIVMARIIPNQTVKVSYFNRQLISSDGTLKLIIGPFTQIIQKNGQAFTGNPGNKNLIIVYGASTKSIPAQTIPYKIIVMCGPDIISSS